MPGSHRSITPATHGGDGPFGPTAGKRIRFRAFSDCRARDYMIHDGRIARDNDGLARQMGVEPQELARRMISEEGGLGHAAPAFAPAMNAPGPHSGRGNDNEWGQRYADILTRIMNADFAAIEQECDRAVALELPGNLSAEGWAEQAAFPPFAPVLAGAATVFNEGCGLRGHDPLLEPAKKLLGLVESTESNWVASKRSY